MSISYIAPIAAGNAVQVFLQPPAGALRWRVLRKRVDTIAAADDPGANVVFDGDDKQFIDTADLVNGTEYFYRPFYLSGTEWVADASRAVTPQADYADITPDVLDMVRTRLDLGFATYVKRGALHHSLDHVPVLLATPAYEDAMFPLVTVHLQSNSPAERFIGEVLAPDYVIGGIGDDTDDLASNEGWLARCQLLIIVWCSNGDVRNDMRKALNAIVLANLPIFEAGGMSLIEPSFGDTDDMNTYQAPMYQTTCTLTCIAPTAVETRSSAIVRSAEAVFINP